MLVQGQGRPRDLQGAYNWLEAARGNGDVAGEPVLAQLRSRKALDPAIASRHAASFRALTVEQLSPPQLFAADQTAADAVATRPMDVVFPDSAVQKGQFGVVWSMHFVGPDGYAADAWPLFSVPREEFDEVIEDAFKRARFTPATLAGRATVSAAITKFRFGYFASVDGDLNQHPPAVQWVRDRRAQADSGDAASQALLGIVLLAYPELESKPKEATRWLESASRAGAVDATFLLGITRTLDARNVEDWRQGMGYLLRAGIGGHPQAQLLVGLGLARDPASEARALDWLAAAAPVEPRAALYLAAELLLAPNETLRDVSRARSLLQPLISVGSERRNPLLWEVAAALSAIDGRLPEAVERQTRAVRLRGESPGRGDSLAQQRLRAYVAGRMWTDRLLPVATRYSLSGVQSARGCEDEPAVGSRIPRCN